MKPPDDARLFNVREWIELAEDDLRVARHTLTIKRRCPYRLVAYHAQQCAEKYLKPSWFCAASIFRILTTSLACASSASISHRGPKTSATPMNSRRLLSRRGIPGTR